MCDLEPDCRRAPAASLEAQRFRYLQKVNDLEIAAPDGEIRRLTPDQRTVLIEALESHADLTFDRAWSLLRLKTPKDSPQFTFNLETGGKKKIEGNRTAAKLRGALGDEYARLKPAQLREIVDDLIAYEKKDALARRLASRYGLRAESAETLSDVRLEDGYFSLSREAIRKLLPKLETGESFATARKQVYGDTRQAERSSTYFRRSWKPYDNCATRWCAAA